MLPLHGRINCQRCFNKGECVTTPHPKWRLVNDPGAWGSATPKYLILGFSKGATQTDIYQNGKFEDVAFGGASRPRLTKLLRSIDLLSQEEFVDNKIADTESSIAFGSLIRCSLTRIDDSHLKKTGNVKYTSSGSLILKSFREIPNIIKNCSSIYLTDLPKTLKVIVFLGVTKEYVKSCKKLISSLYPQSYQEIDNYAYSANNIIWLHIAHPSPANGSFNKWIDENSGQIKANLKDCKTRAI